MPLTRRDEKIETDIMALLANDLIEVSGASKGKLGSIAYRLTLGGRALADMRPIRQLRHGREWSAGPVWTDRHRV
ncbi:hypothetical protein ABEG18_25010 [Alsobacter sp. KACC 23698]|uniref:Uncharacterized protein n=1 Tax=Alsobacter sp. KACC 23698 TaxID=3149229 RepID=A0AAU7JET1_9HYPH